MWAAGTGITRNGANPNYVFGVSAVDDLVDAALPRCFAFFGPVRFELGLLTLSRWCSMRGALLFLSERGLTRTPNKRRVICRRSLILPRRRPAMRGGTRRCNARPTSSSKTLAATPTTS